MITFINFEEKNGTQSTRAPEDIYEWACWLTFRTFENKLVPESMRSVQGCASSLYLKEKAKGEESLKKVLDDAVKAIVGYDNFPKDDEFFTDYQRVENHTGKNFMRYFSSNPDTLRELYYNCLCYFLIQIHETAKKNLTK